MKSQVGEKGQVTIPKRLRDSLGIGPGTSLEFEERDGTLIARRAIVRDSIDALVGILGPGNTDEIMRQLRGPAWTPELDPPDLDPKQ